MQNVLFAQSSSAMEGDINYQAVAAVIIGILFVVALLVVPTIAGMWKVNRKAGYRGWAALVPFYSTIVQLWVARLSGWFALLSIPSLIDSVYTFKELPTLLDPSAPIVEPPQMFGGAMWWQVLLNVTMLAAFAIFVWAAVRTAKFFGKDGWFSLLLILVPFIGYPILGFSDARYQPKKATSKKPIKRRHA